jgi:hypothetical protein
VTGVSSGFAPAGSSPGSLATSSIGTSTSFPSRTRRSGSQVSGISGVHGEPAGKQSVRGSATLPRPSDATSSR